MIINTYIRLVLGLALCLLASGCSHFQNHEIAKWESIEGLPKKMASFKNIPANTRANKQLRELILSDDLFKDKTVYDIGTGTGILALLAVQAGSKYVVATDIDPDAVLNAQFNARHFGFEDKIDVRLVSEKTPEAYSVLKENERFDFITSVPPWTDVKPINLKDRQTHDEGLMLIKSIIKDLDSHLKPGGAALLAIGSIRAIKLIENLAAEHNLKTETLDEKTNEAFIKASTYPSYDYFFLPAAIIKITPLESKGITGAM